MSFSINNRTEIIQNLKENRFDVVIIGGGVTGAGALLDAQSRGMKACLIEMQDFSQGTSSRSTKLIHGGLRYLKQGDLKLVAEVGKERNTLFKNAPYLTQPTEVIVPFIQGGSMGKFTAKIAMIAYEYLAKVEKRFGHKMLKKRHVTTLLPNVRKDNLKGGVIYYEYKTNDSRLVIENIKKAVSIDAKALNYVKATQFLYDESNKISGVKVQDQFTNEEFEIKTKSCVSAVGPWTDSIMQLNDSSAPKNVVLTKGVHIVFPKSKFSLENAVYFEVGDGRMIFAIPKFDKVYIGTTDTFYQDEIANPDVSKEDVEYIIAAIHNNFEKVKLTLGDVIGAWSGLRPLIKEEGKDESEISRKDEVFTTDSGLVAIAGGKLTGYRKMAEKVIDIIEKDFVDANHTGFRVCTTEDIALLGFDEETEQDFVNKASTYSLSALEAEQMYHWFGKQVYQVLKEGSIEGLPDYLGKSLRYCFANEMVTNPIDFVIHRTQIAYFDLEMTLEYLPFVYDFLKDVTPLKEISVYEKQLLELKKFKL